MEESNKLLTFLIVFISCIHTITSSSNDALRCNKVHSDTYYLGQVCTLIGKTIDRSTDWNAQRPDQDSKSAGQIKTIIFQESTVSYVPPQLFNKFTTVHRLFMNETQLETIDSNSFDNAKHLKELYLNQNKLDTIAARTFSKAKQCHILDLSQNRIQNLDVDAFEGLSTVRKLLLNLNQISTLPQGVFQPLIQLNYLDLSNNNIETFVDGIFEHNRGLQSVDLSYNSIKVLSLNLNNNILITMLDVSNNVIEAASISRKPNADKVLTVYAGDNHWQCESLNQTITELDELNIKLTAHERSSFNGKSHVGPIDCLSTSFFSRSDINWPIVAFVVTAAIVFIIGAFVAIFCCRRRRRRGSVISVTLEPTNSTAFPVTILNSS
uniref:CSON002531 protein n=1 Tax=Culicoides sonorensis TaxID=179676 RepID=A0A336K6U8_CULSO